MENRIRAYEKFIKESNIQKLTINEREKLAKYHHEMMQNFQKERIVHLIITLFFTLVTIIFLLILIWTLFTFAPYAELIPFYILVGILVILTGFYIKHYYFLENHIQKLYDYTAKIYKIN